MKVYLLYAYDYDNDWPIRAYYLEEEVKDVIHEFRRFIDYVGEGCSYNALMYEVKRILGADTEAIGINYQTIDIV